MHAANEVPNVIAASQKVRHRTKLLDGQNFKKFNK
jgi:hypothetical protein